MTDKKTKPETKELTDADLDKVAGGFKAGAELSSKVVSKGPIPSNNVASTAGGNPEGFTKSGNGSDI